ncbi:hypothetical protein ACF3MZ_17680 [Paenibacillaceae bacterium WGS1546]|uniref:hypothetical protein n=1 Tax=Cohnella sp. WGS1546 TaxID=3366810 RepID=UPI00372D149B
MEFPSWFQSVIQDRLDSVAARILYHPDLSKPRAEEKEAFNALLTSVNTKLSPEYMEWEDKHHYRRALENERLYLQGMRDGAKLVMALLSDPSDAIEQAGISNSAKSASHSER